MAGRSGFNWPMVWCVAGEVILSAGAIGSPRLLQLSGIGPADHLRDLGIPVVLDQPGVGSNLQDHLDLFVIAECTGPHTYDRFAKPHLSALAGLQYLLTRKGPVASSLFETGGFWYADPDARSPDIQLHLGLGSGIEAGVAAMPQGGVTLNSAYLRPRSRGTVRLASADPMAAPLIDPNYWADPYDREMSIRGLKLAREIMRQDALKPYVLAERLPGPEVRTDEDYFNYACAHAKTDHHPAGTCRMGADPAAVVDPITAVQRDCRAARRRCVDHADADFLQHQCRCDHDRGKGGRYDQGCHMIRHIVLIRFKPDVTEAAVAEIFAALPRLSARLPGVLGFASGRSESPEQIERGYMHGFTIDFADWDSLATYQADAGHKAFGGALGRRCGWRDRRAPRL